MRIGILVFALFACSRTSSTPIAAAKGMKISSPAFADGQQIPRKYTCDGGDTIPPLKFADIPPSAKSLALIVDDPDAPGGTFDHWIVWNISPSTTAVAEGVAPKGVMGSNGFGKDAYGGPCPPSGEHRYVFKLYALDTTMSLTPSSGKSELESVMSSHVVAQAEMTGRYKR